VRARRVAHFSSDEEAVGSEDEEDEGNDAQAMQSNALFGGASTFFERETRKEVRTRRAKLLKELKSEHSQRKIKTLAQLQLPSEAQARRICKDFMYGNENASKSTRKRREAVVSKVCRNIAHDVLMLREGFNLLFYGLGSKKMVLEAFAMAFRELETREKTPCSCALITAGYSSAFNMMNLAMKIAREYIGVPEDQIVKRRSPDQMVSLIIELVEEIHRRDLFCNKGGQAIVSAVNGIALKDDAPVWTKSLCLFVHNIDGELMRTSKVKNAMAKLASCPKVHFVASIDHVSAPLLWDQKQLEQMNWIWRKANTFEPYMFETIYSDSFVRSRQATSSKGISFVLSSLTPNHISVLQVLAEHQMDSRSMGMPFSELLRECQDQMFVSTERAFRNLLIEFKDHRIVASRAGADGKELLYIPYDEQVIRTKILKEES